MRTSLLGDGSVLAFVLEADLSAFFGRRGDIQSSWGEAGGWGVGSEEVSRGSYEAELTGPVPLGKPREDFKFGSRWPEGGARDFCLF